jgi:hypothetical protein
MHRSASLSTRKATSSDIPFLARIEYEASLQPLNYSFWTDLLNDTPTNALQFIEAKLRANASNWGNISDFLILEEQGKPVAAAAGYASNPEDYCPLRLSGLSQIAQDLHWSNEMMTVFRERYLE